jgi:hypothetical protein
MNYIYFTKKKKPNILNNTFTSTFSSIPFFFISKRSIKKARQRHYLIKDSGSM